MRCRKCTGPTIQKQTKIGIAYECTAGCMDPKNPKYPLTTWPPKPVNKPEADGTTMLLTEILRVLQRIETILANPKTQHISKQELEPDENIPF